MRNGIGKIGITLSMLLGMMFVGGCDEGIDTTPPFKPKGVRSITGDGQVTLVWLANQEPDLSGYYIYRNDAPSGYFERIGVTSDTFYIDRDVENGRTYYYAVSAFDIYGNESDLSDELVFDTPRPAGEDVVLRDYHTSPSTSGWDFSAHMVVPYNDPSCNIFYEYDTTYGLHFMNTANGTLIQDFGYTESLDDVDYAPEEGWSRLGWVELIVGHSYIVRTADMHYAKFRVTALGPGYCQFDWAYQVDQGNRELSVEDSRETIVTGR